MTKREAPLLWHGCRGGGLAKGIAAKFGVKLCLPNRGV